MTRLTFPVIPKAELPVTGNCVPRRYSVHVKREGGTGGLEWRAGDGEPCWTMVERDTHSNRWDPCGKLDEEGRLPLLLHFGLGGHADRFPLDRLRYCPPAALYNYARGVALLSGSLAGLVEPFSHRPGDRVHAGRCV